MKVLFRDGEREVPDHVGALLMGIDTYKLTYEQGLAAMNTEIVSDHLRKAQQRIVTEHFKNHRR